MRDFHALQSGAERAAAVQVGQTSRLQSLLEAMLGVEWQQRYAIKNAIIPKGNAHGSFSLHISSETTRFERELSLQNSESGRQAGTNPELYEHQKFALVFFVPWQTLDNIKQAACDCPNFL